MKDKIDIDGLIDVCG